MKENAWAKTTLSVYRYLDRVCNAIDNVIEKKALASFYVCSANFANSSIINVADKIIALSERKKTLINLKVLVTDALKNCQKVHAQLLIEKYIDGDKSADIACRHNLALRSYFRKLSSAESEFSSQLAFLGFGEKRLSEFLAKESWILDVYSNYCTLSREECFQINEARLKKLAFS